MHTAAAKPGPLPAAYRRRYQSRARALTSNWLAEPHAAIISTRREDVRPEALLELLLSSPGALPPGETSPDRLRARLSCTLSTCVVVAAAFARDPAAQPAVTQGWSLVPQPPRRRLVGFAAAAGDTTLVATLCLLAVEPLQRRKGTGKRLVAAIVSQLRATGVTDVGSAVGTAEQLFFERCSFGPDTEGALYMQLRADRRAQLLRDYSP
jgi:GNAT superfamily N-acetyltransferase